MTTMNRTKIADVKPSDLAVPVIKLDDYCDRCSMGRAAAVVQAGKSNLYFCAYHWRTHGKAILGQGHTVGFRYRSESGEIMDRNGDPALVVD